MTYWLKTTILTQQRNNKLILYINMLYYRGKLNFSFFQLFHHDSGKYSGEERCAPIVKRSVVISELH